MKLGTLLACALVLSLAPAMADQKAAPDDARYESTDYPGKLKAGARLPAALRLQVLLDKDGFRPGEIDGVYGKLTSRALKAFQQAKGLKATGRLNKKSWKALNDTGGSTLTTYTVAATDAEGPFVKVPEDMMERAKLKSLGYESALEGLAEKFHSAPALLERLNEGVEIKEGAQLKVPAVSVEQALSEVAKIRVTGDGPAVMAYDADDRLIAYFPASAGTERDPLPVGEWEIRAVALDPQFHYNPELFWDSDPEHSEASIAPGPNNPVGKVWIDISKEHYGLHGTPAPETIGRAQSHGCIRLTNWDAMLLANAVRAGVPVIIEGSGAEAKTEKRAE